MKVRYKHHQLKNIHWLPLWWVKTLMLTAAYYLDKWGMRLNMFLIDKLK